MVRRIAAIALAISASAAAAQIARPVAIYQPVSEVPGGWIWYLNKGSVRVDTPTTRRFWMTGDNRGTSLSQHSMMQVKVDCTVAQQISLHITTYDANHRIITDTLRGDDPTSWTRITAGTPVAAARAWVCR